MTAYTAEQTDQMIAEQAENAIKYAAFLQDEINNPDDLFTEAGIVFDTRSDSNYSTTTFEYADNRYIISLYPDDTVEIVKDSDTSEYVSGEKLVSRRAPTREIADLLREVTA